MLHKHNNKRNFRKISKVHFGLKSPHLLIASYSSLFTVNYYFCNLAKLCLRNKAHLYIHYARVRKQRHKSCCNCLQAAFKTSSDLWRHLLTPTFRTMYKHTKAGPIYVIFIYACYKEFNQKSFNKSGHQGCGHTCINSVSKKITHFIPFLHNMSKIYVTKGSHLTFILRNVTLKYGAIKNRIQ
jgi:hypothetical protein